MGTVIAVCRAATHAFSKPPVAAVRLVAGLGVAGDAHAGATVKHRSRVRRDATAPNLRQVHLLHAELFDDLAGAGHALAPGDLGENITTRGIDLLALPRHTRLFLGPEAIVRVTGLRNPCRQIDDFAPGLLRRVLVPAGDGGVRRLAGIMGVVERGGDVAPADAIRVQLPDGEHLALEPV
jgi:MOSC domain-containing protein YiiM